MNDVAPDNRHPCAWPECTPDLYSMINTARFFAVVADEALALRVAALVDHIVDELAAAPHTDVTPVVPPPPSTRSQNRRRVAAESVHVRELPSLTRVRFTTPANQRLAQYCLALHGRVPFLTLVDTRDEDDEFCFVLDLAPWQNEPTSHALETAVRDFVNRVLTHREPRAMQGAAPPPDHIFPPTHGVVLCEGRCAVTSSFRELRDRYVSQACGCVCVYWSDRCACCPGVLAAMELVVGLVRRVAACHTAAPSSTTISTPQFQFIACNIDDNDFDAQDWAGAEGEKTVPSITAFPAHQRQCVTFTGERTAAALVQFVCDHCLPPASKLPQVTLVRQTATQLAQLHLADTDLLMRTLDAESNVAYQLAADRLDYLMERQREHGTTASTQELDEVRQLLQQARRGLFDIAAIVTCTCQETPAALVVRPSTNHVADPAGSAACTTAEDDASGTPPRDAHAATLVDAASQSTRAATLVKPAGAAKRAREEASTT